MTPLPPHFGGGGAFWFFGLRQVRHPASFGHKDREGFTGDTSAAVFAVEGGGGRGEGREGGGGRGGEGSGEGEQVTFSPPTHFNLTSIDLYSAEIGGAGQESRRRVIRRSHCASGLGSC